MILTVIRIYLSYSYHNFPQVLLPVYILCIQCIVVLDLLMLMDVLDILFEPNQVEMWNSNIKLFFSIG